MLKKKPFDQVGRGRGGDQTVQAHEEPAMGELRFRYALIEPLVLFIDRALQLIGQDYTRMIVQDKVL